MSKILINISRKYLKHEYYDIAYKDLYAKHNIITYNFFDKNISKNNENTYCEYQKVFFYSTKQDLLNKIKRINKNDIYYINTFDELLVLLTNEIKQDLWFEISSKYEAFRNKNQQRELLQKLFPETTVSYFEIDLLKDDVEQVSTKLDFPYIIKPVSWIQSSWVVLINSKLDLEEYIKNEKELEKICTTDE